MGTCGAGAHIIPSTTVTVSDQPTVSRAVKHFITRSIISSVPYRDRTVASYCGSYPTSYSLYRSTKRVKEKTKTRSKNICDHLMSIPKLTVRQILDPRFRRPRPENAHLRRGFKSGSCVAEFVQDSTQRRRLALKIKRADFCHPASPARGRIRMICNWLWRNRLRTQRVGSGPDAPRPASRAAHLG